MSLEHERFGLPDPGQNMEELDLFDFDGNILAFYSEMLENDRFVNVDGRSYTLLKGTIFAEAYFGIHGTKSTTLASGLADFNDFFRDLDEAKNEGGIGIPQFLYGLTNARLARFASRLGFVSLDGVDLKKIDPNDRDKDYEIGALTEVVRSQLEHFKDQQINGESVAERLERRAERHKIDERTSLDKLMGYGRQNLFLSDENIGLRRKIGFAIDASVVALAIAFLPEDIHDKDLVFAGLHTLNAAAYGAHFLHRLKNKDVGII